MNMKSSITKNSLRFLAAFVSVAGGCFNLLEAQRLSDTERDILTLQDLRSLGEGRLLSYLANSDANLRYRAAMACANLQDSISLPHLLRSLRDSTPKVREAAAFALGQLRHASSQDSILAVDSLIAGFRVENDPSVQARILEAMGRIGDEQALDAVTEFPDSLVGAVKAEQAMSIGRFALRGIKNERSMWFCFDLLGDQNPEVRWGALFALWRTAPHGLIDVEISKRRDDLVKLAADPSPDVRMNLVTLLGRSKSRDLVDVLRALERRERQKGDWRVQVQIVLSLAMLVLTNQDLAGDFLEYLNSENDHVKIASLVALAGLPRQTIQSSKDSTRVRQTLLRLADTKSPKAELVRGEAFVSLARIFPDDFNKKNFINEKDLSVREKTKVLEGLSLIPTAKSMVVVLRHLESDSIRIAMAAWDFIRRFLTPSTISRMRSGDPDLLEIRSMLYSKTLNSLKRGDMAITNLVANALGDTSFYGMLKTAGNEDSLISALSLSYDRLNSPDDNEAMQAVLVAMGRINDARFLPSLEKGLKDRDRSVADVAMASLRQITGKDTTAPVSTSSPPVHVDFDWETFESVKPGQTATLQTSKGTIRFQLLRDEAPFTVLSFVKLVKRRFFDGLSFHRVVPNFVVQGGDPRGDGWGGPGYAIRSEYSLQKYDRGSFGVASSGKDTEGCQFFITHLPTPHLDGRYTIFARLVEGFDVLDNLQVGDTIVRITLD